MSSANALSAVFARHDGEASRLAMKQQGWSARLWNELLATDHASIDKLGDALMQGSTRPLTDLLRATGHHGHSLPLAETAMAAWMLKSGGLPMPRAVMTVAPVQCETLQLSQQDGRWLLSGQAARVPWASKAACIAVLAAGPAGNMLACVDAAVCRIMSRRSLAGELRDDVGFDVKLDASRVVPAPPAVSTTSLHLHGALMRSVQMAGALERALELSIAHARQREQFGRKIAQFQAIQHELARLAGETAVAVAAALSAAGATARAGHIVAAQHAVAAAKARTSQAAGKGGLIAHQIHGALGLTDRHPLHHTSLRLWAWREEYGNETHWAQFLGESVMAADADAFWPTLTDEQS